MSEKKGLNFWTLVMMGFTAVVGVGIFSTMGVGIGMTGHSAWLAFVVAMLLVMLMYVPLYAIQSSAMLPGGMMSIIGSSVSKVVAGTYSVLNIVYIIGLGSMAVGLNNYIATVLPEGFPPKVATVIICTILAVANHFGTNAIAKLQWVFTVCLFAGMALYAFVGFGKLTEPVFEFSNPQFFSNGFQGFFSACIVLMGTMIGINLVTGFSRDASKPTHDLPKSMIVSLILVMICYVGIAIPSVGVMPLDEVAGETITMQARVILKDPLFALFIIGGPLMAIITTLNADYALFRIPVERASEMGFLPKSWSKRNKYGVPWKMNIVLYIISILPVVTGISYTTLLMYTMFFSSILMLIMIYAWFKYPTAQPEFWERRKIRMSKGVYYFFCAVAVALQLATMWTTVKKMNLAIGLVTLVLLALFAAYSAWRIKTGKADYEVNVELIPSED